MNDLILNAVIVVGVASLIVVYAIIASEIVSIVKRNKQC